MQRSMREDVGPTLVADTSSGLTSLSSWSKGRRLVHSVQENTLILESFSPRVQLSRVMSLGCYLCGCSISRPQSSASLLSMPLSPPLSSASSSDQQRVQSLGGSVCGRSEMYRMRFNDNDEDNKPLCHHCHGRMVAVCSFFSYLKIVRKGLIKRPIADIWLEVNKARLQMWLARSGASPDSR
ncbi:RAB3A interacting protein, partial [Coemansia aciculifera]